MPDQITILKALVSLKPVCPMLRKRLALVHYPNCGAKCGIADGTARSIFANGTADAVAHFSNYTDRKMVTALESIPYCALRTRDRICAAILIRFEVLEPHKDIVKQSMAFWALPTHVIQGQRILWAHGWTHMDMGRRQRDRLHTPNKEGFQRRHIWQGLLWYG